MPKSVSTEAQISVVMAFHEGPRHLGDAIASVLAQTHHRLELLLCEDASPDGCRSVAEDWATRDGRVRVLTSDLRGGPGNARNRGLDSAVGDWIAVVDADDLIHPTRLARMVSEAEGLDTDIIADDLLYFGGQSGRSLLQRLQLSEAWHITAGDLLAGETAPEPLGLGYLKPLIRRRALGTLRYRGYMSVGEDFDLLLRLVLSGASMAVLPRAFYLYRRHAASISHRLSAEDIAGMEQALQDLRRDFSAEAQGFAGLLNQRADYLAHAGGFAALVSRLKARRVGAVAAQLLRHPGLFAPLFRSVRENLGRRVRRPVAAQGQTELALAVADAGGPQDAKAGRFDIPEAPEDWTTACAMRLVAATNSGNTQLVAEGHAGLQALGYIPGWARADLTPPPDGWTDIEAATIAALPWPVEVTDVSDAADQACA